MPGQSKSHLLFITLQRQVTRQWRGRGSAAFPLITCSSSLSSISFGGHALNFAKFPSSCSFWSVRFLLFGVCRSIPSMALLGQSHAQQLGLQDGPLGWIKQLVTA